MMPKEKQSRIVKDYLESATDPALKIQKPTVSDLAVVPLQSEQLVSVSSPPEGETVEQDLIPARPQSPQQQQKKKRFKRRLAIALCTLIALLLLSAGGFAFYEINFATVHDVTAFRVGQQKMVPQYIGGGGIIYPRQQVNISYPAPLHIINVLVNAGDHVTQGQPLIKLDADQVNAQINQAQDNVDAAQNYLNSVSGTADAVAVAAATHSLEEAQNKLKALQAQTSFILQDDQLVSPIAGTVTNINAAPDSTSGTNATLLTIADQSSVIMQAKIPLENLSQVHIGMKALVTPSALPDQTFNGTVASITPQADSQTDTFQVAIQVPNTQQMLLTGMSAFVRIQGQVKAFVVPQLAVLNPDRESSVFLIRNGHAFMKSVHAIGQSTSNIYLDNGLTNNDLIVLIPLYRMHQGQDVHVIKTEQ